MSIAQHSYTQPAPSTVKLHPVFVVRADPEQDVCITLLAKANAPIGAVEVYLSNPHDDPSEPISMTDYVETLRTFARHLATYADAFEDAAFLDF